MNSRQWAAAAVALVATVSVARADATLTPVEGGVLVFKGQGFVRTTQPSTLKVGDKAMVAQGNRGKITFSDGCAVDLRPGTVQIIGPVSPCAQAQGTADPANAGVAGVAGYAVAGAVFALGGASAAISLSQSDASTTSGISP